MAVKMRPNSTRTKRPYGALLYPGPVLDSEIVESRREFSDKSETPPVLVSQNLLMETGNVFEDKVWLAVLLGRYPAKR